MAQPLLLRRCAVSIASNRDPLRAIHSGCQVPYAQSWSLMQSPCADCLLGSFGLSTGLASEMPNTCLVLSCQRVLSASLHAFLHAFLFCPPSSCLPCTSLLFLPTQHSTSACNPTVVRYIGIPLDAS